VSSTPLVAAARPGGTSPARVSVGHVPMDVVGFRDALGRIAALVEGGHGGTVFTPNVDHVVLADADAEFRDGYRNANLSLVDGTPLLWAARLLGHPLPEKISGSDLLVPLAELAARRGWGVYLLGGGPGIAERVAAELERRLGLRVAGLDAPRIDLGPGGAAATAEALERLRQARPHLVLLALGSPKQEIWMHRHRAALSPAVAVGVGASFDFLVGVQSRAPRWMSRAGLEWLYRLSRDPRRLWRRYLVNDPRFVGIFWRTWRSARRARGPA
jgi:N-acetylglucosaminyldiphosphoundecaprenol N-acetyl-beta-D-mannosaminyltransferase